MKYRIVVRKSPVYPYEVERGREQQTEVKIWAWFRTKMHLETSVEWHKAGIFNSVKEAQEFIQKDIELVKSLGKDIVPGNVVFEYDESDMVVERLKGLR